MPFVPVRFAYLSFIIQVMKMVMTLTAQQSGCIHFVKRPGAVLEPGCVVARMDLDDPSSIHRVGYSRAHQNLHFEFFAKISSNTLVSCLYIWSVSIYFILLQCKFFLLLKLLWKLPLIFFPLPSQVELNTAVLPPQQPLPMAGEKLHQVFHSVLENLVNVMDGYCLEEPYFSTKVYISPSATADFSLQDTKAFYWCIRACLHVNLQLKEWVATLMKTLRDPSLPLLELQEIMTSVAGRIPPTVEKDIRKVMAQYASNITSVLCQFPSQRVKCYAKAACELFK